MAEIELQGMQELLNKVEELGKRGKRIENKAILAAAKPILDAAAKTTLFYDVSGDGRAGLKVSRVYTKGDTKRVIIGIEKGDISEIFYMKMIEFGTSKMVARPFLQNAYILKKGEAMEILKKEFRKGLGL